MASKDLHLDSIKKTEQSRSRATGCHDRLNILMSGSPDPNSLISIYGKIFEEQGHDVHRHFSAFDAGLSGSRIIDRAINRLLPVIPDLYSSTKLERLAREVKPDVVILFKGMDIQPKTLERLKGQGLKLVCYNADHPFEFAMKGTGNSNVSQSVPLYDLYITYSDRICQEINLRHPALDTAVVPFGHSVSHELYERISATPDKNRACFVGTADAQRAKAIGAFQKSGIPIDVYGPGWKRFAHTIGSARVMGPVYGEDMYRVLRAYRVQLNLFRPHNSNSHNMRSFEIPASGGIMLAPSSPEHELFFDADVEALYYSETKSMIEKAESAIGMSFEQASQFRARARARTTTSGYTYRDRAVSLMAHVLGLFDSVC